MLEHHGMYNSRLYGTWEDMKTRCTNPNCKSYVDYGGRGISVCEIWKNSFTAFMVWALNNGYQDGLTIDRINNNKGYCPDNCKWSTSEEQGRNRRSNTIVTVDGMTATLVEWSEKTGVPSAVISRRIRKGWSQRDAVTTPARRTIRSPGHRVHNARAVIRVEDGRVYASAKEAADDIGIDNSSVVKACKGKRKLTHGYRFMYWPQEAGEECSNDK